MIETTYIPEACIPVVEVEYRKRKSFYEKEAKNAYSGEIPDYPITKRCPLERLVILCCCIPAIKQRYISAGVPADVTDTTLDDIRLRAGLYWEKTKKVGLSKDDSLWFRHLYFAEIVQFGSLQFQPMSMIYLDKEGCGEDFMTFGGWDKTKLPQDTPVINVHIPARADLTPGAVNYAFTEAANFFAPKAGWFVCYSWLLYPPTREFLAEESNIYSFAENFQIIGLAGDPWEGIHRIYGKKFRRKGEYPQNTSLQRSALGNFSKLGEACGVKPL